MSVLLIVLLVVGAVALFALTVAVLMRATRREDFYPAPEPAVDPPRPTSGRSSRRPDEAIGSFDDLFLAPVFNQPVERLRDTFDLVARHDRRVRVADRAVDRNAVTYARESRILALPDYISVEFIALGANRSSFAVFSRTFRGQSGGGDAAEPVKSWVPKIREQLAR